MYIIGINPTAVRTSSEGPAFKLGTLGAVAPGSAGYTAPMSDTGTTAGASHGPRAFVYVQVTSSVTAGQAVIINASHAAVPAAALASSTGYRVGAAYASIDAGGYGWVQVYGDATVNVVSGTAVGTAVSTSGTAGSLDDLTAGAGLRPVTGVLIGSVNGTTGSVFLNWPVIGAAFS